MPKVNLTDRAIRSLPTPVTGQVDYFDENLPGFGVRLGQGGRKSFFVMYRRGRQLRRFTLGPYPNLSLMEGRRQAKAAFHDVAHGADPASERTAVRKAETFGELAEEYLEHHARARKRTWQEDERILWRDLLPALGRISAKAVTRRQVRELLDEIVQRGSGVMANRTLALVRKVFNFGIQRDIVEVNPCSGLARPAIEQQRDRVLTDDEIRGLWGACDTEPGWVAGAIRLYLLTAQRKEEVLAMRWSELDLTTGWWTIPAERAKNGLAHRVPLSPAARVVLQELRSRGQGSEFVFLSAKTNAALTTIQKPILRLRARTGIDFRLHDLRRTAASLMTGIGISRLVVSKILNHVEHGVTSIYDRHSYDREKREAMDAWADRLDTITVTQPMGSGGGTGPETYRA